MFGRVEIPTTIAQASDGTEVAFGPHNIPLMHVYTEEQISALAEDPHILGDVRLGFGKAVLVPVPGVQTPGAMAVVHTPSWWWLAGAFGLGWAGGYLAWVYIGKMQAKKARLMGLAGTPEEHSRVARKYLDRAGSALRRGNSRGALLEAARAEANAEWTGDDKLLHEAQEIIGMIE